MPDGIELGKIEVRNKILFLTCSTLLASLLLLVTCQNNDPITAPTGLRMEVVNDGGGDVDYVLSWNEVPNADYYWIEMDGGDGGGTSFTYYNYYTLEDGLHSFRVKAVNYSNGESPYSSYYNYTVNNGNGGGNGGGSGSDLSAPTGVSADVSESRIYVTWNSVSNASYYRVYRSSSSSGSYSMLESTSSTYYYDASPNTENYYKVTAVNSIGIESEKSDWAYCYYSSGGGGSAPSAPTGVSAEVSGSKIKVSWNSVPNATRYNVYYSSTGGSYSYLGCTLSNSSTTFYHNYPSEDNYYKIKADNIYGESSFSSYAYCHYSSGGGGGGGGGGTVYSPCPVHYTSHTATSTTITLRWSNPTTTGCGTPTSATLRVRNPDSGVYADLQTLSGTATTASFSYGMWADSDGYVYCGIITENSSGTSGGLPLVYNWKTNTWYGGNGKQYTDVMENEEFGFSNIKH